jgi:hypothetical protein
MLEGHSKHGLEERKVRIERGTEETHASLDTILGSMENHWRVLNRGMTGFDLYQFVFHLRNGWMDQSIDR